MPPAVPAAIENLIDEGSFELAVAPAETPDPLGFPGYADALAAARTRTGLDDAVVSGAATIGGIDVEIAAFDFGFLGGSMGSLAGEILARAVERASARGVPFVLRTATGGARMQEGMASLVQMPKLAAARLELAGAGLPFLAVFGSPTTGGVLAGFGALADVTIAEAGATVGFAGPRVVRSATGSAPSADSHTAEAALRAGLLDAVVEHGETRAAVGTVLAILASEPLAVDDGSRGSLSGFPEPWDAVSEVRSAGWPRGPELARSMAGSFFELRGDRAGGDDRGLSAGLATIEGAPALVLALDHERPPGPGAFRKAVRCLAVAGRLGLPVVSLVDTRGADPSEDSEAGGIAWAIAALFDAMLTAPVPTVAVVTGEGGSGGALAFATADVLLAYEGSVFSVIAPELAAEILWRDAGRAPEAARLLHVGAEGLIELGIADGLVAGRPSGPSLAHTVAYHLGLLRRGRTTDPVFDDSRRDRWRHKLGY